MAERVGMAEATCPCGVKFWRARAALRRVQEPHCSKRCNGKARAVALRPFAGNGKGKKRPGAGLTGAANPAWKGGVTVFRKHGNYSGVRYVRAPEWAKPMARTDGYIMEHRLQMAVMCGYLMTRTEVVNHEDHDPTNNAPDNLTLWPTNRDHKLYEWAKIEAGVCCRLPESPRPQWTMPEWSGASTYRAGPSSLVATG